MFCFMSSSSSYRASYGRAVMGLCVAVLLLIVTKSPAAGVTFTDWTGTFGFGPMTTPQGTLSLDSSTATVSIIGTYVSTGSKFDGTSTQFSDSSVFNPDLPNSDAMYMALGPSNTTVAIVTSVTLDHPVLYMANIGTGLYFTLSTDTGSTFTVMGSSSMTRSGSTFTSTGSNGLLALSFSAPVNEIDLSYNAGAVDAVAFQLGNGQAAVVPEPTSLLLLAATGVFLIMHRRRPVLS